MKALHAATVCLLVPFSFAIAQQPATQAQEKNCCANCPMHKSMTASGQSGAAGGQMCPQMSPQMNSQASMNQRGEQGMGFSQTVTTHHFFLYPDGGAIQVEANDPKDASDRDKIRMHLSHIAQAFANGDFDIPMFVHDTTTPPGVPEMKHLRDKIKYTYSETANGGRVVISTADPDALAAIHNFLRFQIQQHNTGDPVVIRQ